MIDSPEVKTDPEFPTVAIGDFICPWSYAAIGLVDRLSSEYGLRPWWRPHLLRPGTPLEGAAYDDTTRRGETIAWLKEVAPEASERMRFPDRIRHSFLAFQAVEFADDNDLGWEFTAAVFGALWVAGKDIAQVETLQAAADQVHLDADELGRSLASEKYRDRAAAAVQQAVGIGVTATPTLILGRTRVNGWHYYEVLENIVKKQKQGQAVANEPG